MTRISPMDLSFLLLDNASRPLHMAAFTMFQKPKGTAVHFRIRVRNMKGPTGQLYLAGAPLVAFWSENRMVSGQAEGIRRSRIMLCA